MLKYQRIYAMLKRCGHSPMVALQIIVDAARNDKSALNWIRALRHWK